jgi:hypothetical protein
MPLKLPFTHKINAALLMAVLAAGPVLAQNPALTPDVKAALDHISADSLRGHLSFIASDALEGRNTPSRGLDIAAEYIAAQFRRAGLEPIGDDGYFQTANWFVRERNADAFDVLFEGAQGKFGLHGADIVMTRDGGSAAVALSNIPVFKVDFNDAAALGALTQTQVQGKVVLTELPSVIGQDRTRVRALFTAQREFLAKVDALKPAFVLSVDRSAAAGGANGGSGGRLIDPERRPAVNADQPSYSPVMTIRSPEAAKLYDGAKAGPMDIAVTVSAPAVAERPVKIRNVAGVLRGSDPALKETYVLVTAHYDHLGMLPGGAGDTIYNGANDDGSGTVSVMEIAGALAKLPQHPKRSILFMTFFGEEKGLLGSRYYGKHPLVPIEKTVADINLEQIGRTDDTQGPQIAAASLTGFDYTDVGPIFQAAGEAVGVTVSKRSPMSDAYFGRSDNQALADQGVPAHTLCVAYEYPDYHGLGDHWEKVDYANMAKIDRMVALGLVAIANNPVEPKWNESNPRTQRYVQALKERKK